MTIRNFLPGFEMRTVAALAVVAAVVIAALLAVGSPASAQSSTGDEIWSATMTVGNFPIGPGFRNSDIGSLSDDDFTFDGEIINISLILDSAADDGKLLFGIDEKLSDPQEEAWTLHIGGRTFDFADATYSADSTYDHVYTWPITNNRFGWATSNTVAVKITALPIITIEAVTSTVEYGGNNNVAESTAEFKFTRTGSTDNALSFTLNYNGIFSGESATRKFEAGQSSFSNFHWAVEVDNNDNPVCSFFWTVLSGDGYVVDTPDTAFVTIEGPGTTCMATM